MAVKKFNEDSLSYNDRDFLSETAFMFVLKHRNIVPLIGISTEPDNIFIVAKYYERGCLTNIIFDKTIFVTLHRRVKMLLDVAKGIKFLHTLSIIHR